jgi:hypothetical protein
LGAISAVLRPPAAAAVASSRHQTSTANGRRPADYFISVVIVS